MTTSRTLAGVCAGFALLAATLAPVSTRAAEWSDTSIGWRYGTRFAEPANPQDISKNIFSLTHASGYKYGVNFFNVDMLISDSKDPAAGGGGGAHEVYVVYRNTLDFGKISGKDLSYGGIIRSYGFQFGFDLNSKDDPFGARKRMPVLGPTIMFDVPGFLQFTVLFAKEWDHTALPVPAGGQHDVVFDHNNIFELEWGIPFMLGSIATKFQGYAQFETAKGKDYFGGDTAPETHLDFALMFDVGAALGAGKNTFLVGPEYEYWRNKFGNKPGVGTIAKTPMIKLEYHF